MSISSCFITFTSPHPILPKGHPPKGEELRSSKPTLEIKNNDSSPAGGCPLGRIGWRLKLNRVRADNLVDFALSFDQIVKHTLLFHQFFVRAGFDDLAFFQHD